MFSLGFSSVFPSFLGFSSVFLARGRPTEAILIATGWYQTQGKHLEWTRSPEEAAREMVDNDLRRAAEQPTKQVPRNS